MNGLQLQGIGKSYGPQQVLKSIDLDFAAGQVTAIVGDNGAGKSTLLKIIAGLCRPDIGHIHLDGSNLTALAAGSHRAHGIEMVYQDLALARQQDVTTNLFLGRELTRTPFGILDRRMMRQWARQELDRLGIVIAHHDRPVGLLSGGQQQAVAIARAVLFDPKVLLLDEPTAALAAREVQQVIDLVRTQRELGRIVILVSHRLNDVFAVADRIVVLKQGSLVADTPAAGTSLPQVVEAIVS
jgi:ABC-type sugar transport system ATPase subunit